RRPGRERGGGGGKAKQDGRQQAGSHRSVVPGKSGSARSTAWPARAIVPANARACGNGGRSKRAGETTRWVRPRPAKRRRASPAAVQGRLNIPLAHVSHDAWLVVLPAFQTQSHP